MTSSKARTNVYGYDRIKSVSGETYYADDGEIITQVVWIETVGGETLVVDLLNGETLDGVVARYETQGWSDDRCCFHSRTGRGA
jgi:hypothetical protein